MFTKEECYAVQKAMGIIMMVIGILSIFIDWDITFAVLAVPFGLYVARTKDIVLSLDYDEEENGKS